MERKGDVLPQVGAGVEVGEGEPGGGVPGGARQVGGGCKYLKAHELLEYSLKQSLEIIQPGIYL